MSQELQVHRSRTRTRIASRGAAAIIAALALVVSLAAPAGAQASSNAQGWIADQIGVGFFYGTFNEGENTALLAGGSVEEFCFAGPDGDPGSAPSRVFLRNDDSVDIKSNETAIPIYLYSTDVADIPTWLDSVCPDIINGGLAPGAFAVGTADLKVRLTVVSPDEVHVFNGVNGKAVAVDGTQYKVKGSADFSLVNGMLTGSPEEFVDFSLQKIRRGR